MVRKIKSTKKLVDESGDLASEGHPPFESPGSALRGAPQLVSKNSSSEPSLGGTLSALTFVPPPTDLSLPLAKPVPTPHLTKKGEVGGEELAEFDVQSPADLLKIARAAGLSYHTVKSLNPEVLRWCTPPNLPIYRIKLPAFIKDRFLIAYNHSAFPRQVQFMTYQARAGETLPKSDCGLYSHS